MCEYYDNCFYDEVLNKIRTLELEDLDIDFDFQDEFTATNPIMDLSIYPRASTPIPEHIQKYYQPIGNWMFLDETYESFKRGLKELPTKLKVRGFNDPHPHILAGNIASTPHDVKNKKRTIEELMRYDAIQLAEYVKHHHVKCRETNNEHTEKKSVSPKSSSAPPLGRVDPQIQNLVSTNCIYPQVNSVPVLPTQSAISRGLCRANDIANLAQSKDNNTSPFRESIFGNSESTNSELEYYQPFTNIDYNTKVNQVDYGNLYQRPVSHQLPEQRPYTYEHNHRPYDAGQYVEDEYERQRKTQPRIQTMDMSFFIKHAVHNLNRYNGCRENMDNQQNYYSEYYV